MIFYYPLYQVFNEKIREQGIRRETMSVFFFFFPSVFVFECGWVRVIAKFIYIYIKHNQRYSIPPNVICGPTPRETDNNHSTRIFEALASWMYDITRVTYGRL